MDIQNRIVSVTGLTTNACQELLKLVIIPGWQQEVYDKARVLIEKDGRFKDKYACAYEKMRDYGIEKYSVDDMDMTFIAELVLGFKHIVPLNQETRNAIRNLKEDRNSVFHLSGNEPEEEVYLIGLLSLYRLKCFLRLVDRIEKGIDDDTRLKYRQTFVEKVDELRDILDDERISSIHRVKELKRDIQLILNSRFPEKAWLDKVGFYLKETSLKGWEQYNDFCILSSDEGITMAHPYAASALIMKGNLEEAENRILKMLQTFDEIGSYEARQMTTVINTYLSKKGTMTEELEKIVAILIEKGFAAKNENGYYDFLPNR